VGALVFLSDAWLAALDAALRADRELASVEPLIVDQVVLDVPDRGDVRYRLVIDHAGARVEHDGTAPADLRLTVDYRTACDLASGRTNAQTVLAAGRLRVGGELAVLAARVGALGALGDAATGLRADTEFPEP
jgi:hypothetical protein